MTNERLKGFTYGAIAAASYGMNPLFALPLYGAGMNADSVLFYCDAGRSDESKETVLRSEKDGYTAVGGDGVAVLFLFVVPVREL